MNDSNQRYARQISLSRIGEEGQQRLSEATVLVIGAGGLGSPASLYLSSAGVGELWLSDFDTVDETNLHRQILFSQDDIGKNKALAAAEYIDSRHPNLKIGPISQRLDG